MSALLQFSINKWTKCLFFAPSSVSPLLISLTFSITALFLSIEAFAQNSSNDEIGVQYLSAQGVEQSLSNASSVPELPASWQTERVTEPVWNSEVFVVQAGVQNRQTVVLVHGLGEAGFTDWMTVIPALEQNYHVIAFDLPGFARSARPSGRYSPEHYSQVLAWLINRYAHNPVMLVGHSMGGAISLQHTANYPHQVERLILVDAAGILERTALLKINGELPINVQELPRPLRGLGARVLDIGRSVIEWTGVTPDPTGIISESSYIWNRLFNDRENGNAALALIMHNFSDAIKTVDHDVFMIWGADDRIAPLRTGQLLAGRLQNVQLEVIEDAAHVPMKSHTWLFNLHLLQALKKEPLEPDLNRLTSANLVAFQHDDKTVKKGVLRCKNQDGGVYSGHFDQVIIEQCHGIRLVNVTARQMQISDSLVELENVLVHNPASEAVLAKQSVITATNARFSGNTGLLSRGTRWDLAGVTIEAKQTGIQVRSKSRFVFSVSDLIVGGQNKNLHRVISTEYNVLDGLL